MKTYRRFYILSIFLKIKKSSLKKINSLKIILMFNLRIQHPW